VREVPFCSDGEIADESDDKKRGQIFAPSSPSSERRDECCGKNAMLDYFFNEVRHSSAIKCDTLPASLFNNMRHCLLRAVGLKLNFTSAG
jgi:hypothetical protein